MAPLVWLITGSTSGSGLALVSALSARGDQVIATGRGASTRIAHLRSPNVAVLDLDVTAPLASIQAVISTAVAIFGRIDVLVNNAGVWRMSALEEASEAFVQGIFDVNLFGAVKTTQAVLPHMRAVKQGTVVFIGAGLGWAAIPFVGYYSLTKAALTMFAESLQKEIGTLGLRSIIFEPGGFDSDIGAPREGEAAFQGPGIDDYQPLFGKSLGGPPPKLAGDVTKIPGAIIDVVKGEGLAKGRPFPVRVVLGPDSLDVIRQKCTEQLQLLDDWEDVSLSTMIEGQRETVPSLMDVCSILPKT
ncbi:hypothetical protein B0T25DRAFT_452273 [Lasiosphaeria hispida]|uniref:NAD(P)-binding protein n=1 Tax=Lasiosphaeria hispida TaxID=260671 RepID=A0AAJ0HKW2_9PEZI|nr:hypothetical protein B0T25DRAFT_452273 [Lasiosphaeria hispida]